MLIGLIIIAALLFDGLEIGRRLRRRRL